MTSDGVFTRETDLYWLRTAIELSRSCPPAHTAFSVGALLVDVEGNVLSDGYSRRDDPSDHAEEAALRQIDSADPRLSSATIYSSLEPCGQRASRPRTCSELILDTPVPRVVFAWREPDVFVPGTGAQRLRAAGRTVVELPELAPLVRDINAHVL